MTDLLILTADEPINGRYVIDGTRYVRVSTVLGVIAEPSILAWKLRVGLEEANRVSLEATTLGTAVHAACEIVDKNPRAAVPPAFALYVNAYREWRDREVEKVLGVESTVFHPKHGYAGTLDRLYRLKDGRVVVADLKTGRSVDAKARLQTMAYAECLELHGQSVDGRMVIHLPSSRPGTLTVIEYDDDVRDRKAWRAALRLYRWKTRHGSDWMATR